MSSWPVTGVLGLVLAEFSATALLTFISDGAPDIYNLGASTSELSYEEILRNQPLTELDASDASGDVVSGFIVPNLPPYAYAFVRFLVEFAVRYQMSRIFGYAVEANPYVSAVGVMSRSLAPSSDVLAFTVSTADRNDRLATRVALFLLTVAAQFGGALVAAFALVLYTDSALKFATMYVGLPSGAKSARAIVLEVLFAIVLVGSAMAAMRAYYKTSRESRDRKQATSWYAASVALALALSTAISWTTARSGLDPARDGALCIAAVSVDAEGMRPCSPLYDSAFGASLYIVTLGIAIVIFAASAFIAWQYNGASRVYEKVATDSEADVDVDVDVDAEGGSGSDAGGNVEPSKAVYINVARGARSPSVTALAAQSIVSRNVQSRVVRTKSVERSRVRTASFVSVCVDFTLLLAWLALVLFSAYDASAGGFTRFAIATGVLFGTTFTARMLMAAFMASRTTYVDAVEMANAPLVSRQLAFTAKRSSWYAYFLTSYVLLPAAAVALTAFAVAGVITHPFSALPAHSWLSVPVVEFALLAVSGTVPAAVAYGIYECVLQRTFHEYMAHGE